MKLKWKEIKKSDFIKVNRWIRKTPKTKQYININFEEKFNKIKAYNHKANHLILKKVYHKHRFVGTILLLYEKNELVIESLIINPKYNDKDYGKIVLNDLILNTTLITKELVYNIKIYLTSDNHLGLRLFKSIGFKLNNIDPTKNIYEFIYKT